MSWFSYSLSWGLPLLWQTDSSDCTAILPLFSSSSLLSSRSFLQHKYHPLLVFSCHQTISVITTQRFKYLWCYYLYSDKLLSNFHSTFLNIRLQPCLIRRCRSNTTALSHVNHGSTVASLYVCSGLRNVVPILGIFNSFYQLIWD